MPINILMPALSPTMEEGKLTRWLVDEGSAVAPGDIIAEIETDKATMDVEAVDEGTMGKLLVAAGTENIAVNTTIAVLFTEGEGSDTAAATPNPVGTDAPSAEPTPPIDDPTPSIEETVAKTVAQRHASPNRKLASPVAVKLAAENGLDLNSIEGTGPDGRVIKRDIEAALASTEKGDAPRVVPASASVNGAKPETATAAATEPAAQALVPSPTESPSSQAALADDNVRALYETDSYEVVPHEAMRTIIAERLTYSKQTIPHFRLSVDCSIDELLRSRQRMNASAPKEGSRAFRLSVNDFIIKALGLALQQVPAANATWTGAGMLRHKYSDVGVAVAVDGGLFTPIVRHCELKSLSEISNEMKHLAARARDRRLAPHEYQGGATSISNLGMYGIKNFDAVINPPQASILAVGAGVERPVVVEGALQVAKVMNATLSCDHRVIDGAVGAEFLDAFKSFIEDPVRMLV